MTTERFTLPDTPVPDDALLNEIMTRGHAIIVRYANRYAAITGDPMLQAEDYYQHVSILLLDYVGENRDEAYSMLGGDESHLERFISILCQRRMRDLWETTQAARREASKTVNASGHATIDAQRSTASFLEVLACDQGPHMDPESAERVVSYCDGLRPLARRVVEVLLWPPAALQQAFLQARTKKSYGAVSVVSSRQPYGHSHMDLKPREGYGTLFWTVDWEGPLHRGVIQTSHGDMTVSDETDMWKLEFAFPLVVLTDGHDGEFEHLTVRPTSACFDLKALASYLSKETGKRIPNQRVQKAWAEAQARYTALFGDSPVAEHEPDPGTLAVEVA